MIKAHSLLYAVYICLIVSIVCGAILYFATLFNQLNLFYNLRESLYIQNQSYVTYALENLEKDNTSEHNPENGVSSTYQNTAFGLLNILQVQTSANSDTISSVHLTGGFSKDKTCLFIAATGNPLYFSGKVKLIGDKKLTTTRIEQKYIDGRINSLNAPGTIQLAQSALPELNPAIAGFFKRARTNVLYLKDIEKQFDSVYFNSFTKAPVEIQLTETILANTTIKGNFILHAADSIYIRKSAILNDVIVTAPKIIIEAGFKGSVQLFASEKIEIGESAELLYPSVLCLYNVTPDKKSIIINEDAKIYGAVVLSNAAETKPDEDVMIFKKNSFLIGDAYCKGKLMVEGVIHGSAYANKVFYQTPASNYDNCIVDAEIDATKRPSYFVSIPILHSETNNYNGVFKKVF